MTRITCLRPMEEAPNYPRCRGGTEAPREEVPCMQLLTGRAGNSTAACLLQTPVCASGKPLLSHFLGVPSLASSRAWSSDNTH